MEESKGGRMRGMKEVAGGECEFSVDDRSMIGR